MEETIGAIKGIDVRKLKNESPLDGWFIQIMNKRINELNISDISRMLRQSIYPDIALKCTWNILISNPFEGEMYEGQLLELLVRYLKENKKNIDKNLYNDFVKIIEVEFDQHEWESEEDKSTYRELLNELKLIV